MGRLVVYETVSLDGYFTDGSKDMSWAHKSDPEWLEYVAGNAKGSGILLFGRKTYEMMASFWPSEMAQRANPVVAERMNAVPKVVFSRTLDKATWNNTTLIKDHIAGNIKKLKEAGNDITILGSGSIVSQVAEAGLVDEFHIVISAIALGNGRTLFEGISKRLPLKLVSSRQFSNGNVVVKYEPAAAGVITTAHA